MLTVTNSYCLPNLSINDSGNSLHIKGTRDQLQMHRDAWNTYCQKIYFSWRTYIYHQVYQICCSFVCEAWMYILFKCLFYKCMRLELGQHYECICPSKLTNIRQKTCILLIKKSKVLWLSVTLNKVQHHSKCNTLQELSDVKKILLPHASLTMDNITTDMLGFLELMSDICRYQTDTYQKLPFFSYLFE